MAHSVSGSLPALYGTVEVLDRMRHKSLRLKSDVGYRFAAAATVLPVVRSEFRSCASSAPIVFVRKDDKVLPQVVLGLSGRGNAFVMPDGAWRSGTYVPAYLRRFPFLLVRDGDRKLVGFEPSAKHFSHVEGEALFAVDGTPSLAVERVRQFCTVFDDAWEQTLVFSKELDDAGVLVPAVTRLAGASPMQIDGFEMVDMDKLIALPADVLKDWVRNGWLDPIHAHRASLDRWSAVVDSAA